MRRHGLPEHPSGRDLPGGGKGAAGSEAGKLLSDIGIDVEGMSPKARAATGLVVGGVILIAAAYVLATGFWWMIFIFGWTLFPALGLFAKGVAEMVDPGERAAPAADTRERELLEVIERRGEVTAARAAMETTLTVSEADAMLSGLAEKGHLRVSVRGGSLVYSFWDPDREGLPG